MATSTVCWCVGGLTELGVSDVSHFDLLIACEDDCEVAAAGVTGGINCRAYRWSAYPPPA